MPPKEKLTQPQVEEAKELGGAEDPKEYSQGKQPGYADKGGHRERSLFHQPRHGKHWRKHD